MRERRNYLLLMGAIAAALVGALLLAIPGSPIYRKPTLGLDLQGGIEVVLRAIPTPEGQPITPDADADRSADHESRVNKLGVTSPNVAIQGTNEIVIQLAGVHDPEQGRQGHRHDRRTPDLRLRAEPGAADRAGEPAACAVRRRSTSCSPTAVVKAANKGAPEYYYLAKTVKKPVTTKVKGKKVTKTVTFHEIVQGPTQSLQAVAAAVQDGQQPKDTTVAEGAAGPAGRSSARRPPRRLPRRRPERNLDERQVLVPVQAAAGADGRTISSSRESPPTSTRTPARRS